MSQTQQHVSDTPAPVAPRQEAQVIQLRPPSRWHDPLRLIEEQPPSNTGRLVLRAVAALVLILIVWASVGQLDIIASADGRLAPQTLLKVVQPVEAGVVRELLVGEGDSVKAGQVMARLDTTLARAESSGVANSLATQEMQARRIEAALADRPMAMRAGDDPTLFAQVQNQALAQRKAQTDALAQERALLDKAEHERRGALQVLAKLEQTLPAYTKAADSFARLEQEGFVGNLASADKRREAIEKTRDLEAQRSAVAALDATIAAQRIRLEQMHSSYRAELRRELADVLARLGQLRPDQRKASYREGLLELRAPQDGVVKDLATTTVGAVVQPGAVVLTLVPRGEQLFADVAIKNEDVGFVRVGQVAQVKLAAFPFQRHGMLSGRVTRVSADASETARPQESGAETAPPATYRARIALDRQTLVDPQGTRLALASGMQVVVEIKLGRRSVMEYLLSPVQKAVAEAARER